MLRILDRYVIREVLAPFGLALSLFTFILLVDPLMKEAQRLIEKGVGAVTILRILATLLPQALGITIPVALLVGLLIGLGRLSADREAVALQACGVSLTRLLRPVAACALAACLATGYVMIWAMPAGNQHYQALLAEIVAARIATEIKPRVFFEDFPNLTFYSRDVASDGAGWRDVFVADRRNPDRPQFLVAARGRLVIDEKARSVDLTLWDGSSHRADPKDPAKYEVQRFATQTVKLDADDVFPKTEVMHGAPEMTISELQAEIAKKRGAEPVAAQRGDVPAPEVRLPGGLPGLRPAGAQPRRLEQQGQQARQLRGRAGGRLRLLHADDDRLVADQGARLPGQPGALAAEHRPRPGGRRAADLPAPPRRRRRPDPPALDGGDTGRDRAAAAVAAPRQPGRRGVGSRRPRGPEPRPGPRRRARRRRRRQRAAGRRKWSWSFASPGASSNWCGSPVRPCSTPTSARPISGCSLLAFAGLLGIFYIGSFIDWSDNLFKGQATTSQLAQYMWYSTPQFVYYVLPLSALVGTLVTIGLLTKSSELIVMRACGVSLYRTALPLLVLGLLWSGLLFGLEESFLAASNRKAAELKHLMRGGAPRTFDVLARQWVAGRDGRIYRYTYFDPRAKTLTGLEVYRFHEKPWGLAETMTVRSASYQAADGTWLADQGWTRRFADDVVTAYTPIAEKPLIFEAASYFGTEQPDADRLSFTSLRRYIAALRVSGFDVVPYRVALHRKIAFPFVALVMTLIAIPFAVTTGRRGALFGIGLGLLLAISYWGLSAVFSAIGGAGLLSPPLAAWAPNVLFISAASYLLLTVRT